jgi:hypothetical protein
MLMS